MPFTVRCARHGCGTTMQVRSLPDLDQLPREWVCPLCADFDQLDAINHMEKVLNQQQEQRHGDDCQW